MSFRISPLWWPLLLVMSPIYVPLLLVRNRTFKKYCTYAYELNRKRLNEATSIELPELDFLELTVLIEEKTEKNFLGDTGVSYLLSSNQGVLLFDVGFGPESSSLAHNASRLGITINQVDALVISHLHFDHMGGFKAGRSKCVVVPEEMGKPNGQFCYLPDKAVAEGFKCKIVDKPHLLTAGFATTGPLASSLFFLGLTEEQALIASVKDKGIVIITGCGHPKIELILEMTRCLSAKPIYAICGGLHFPITGGRVKRAGIQFQAILGTGKPLIKKIKDEDLSKTITVLNSINFKKLYISAHDSCDHSLERLQNELKAETVTLKAGATYHI